MSNALTNISPIDGRYRKVVGVLESYFSEHSLIRYRLTAMLEYLRLLMRTRAVPTPILSDDERHGFEAFMTEFSASFTPEKSEIVKLIETKGMGRHKATNHDVKACELYLRDRLERAGFQDLVEWVHFGCTSEDVNNTAYALMLQASLDEVILPALRDVGSTILGAALTFADMPMLARTHGQQASPTTLGKEFAVFGARLGRQYRLLSEHKTLIKLNGASGNYCASHFALPEIDWLAMSEDYLRYLRDVTGRQLDLNPLTTQIEPHDTYAELFHILFRINTILIDFCQDIWRYVSDDWLRQKPVEGEVGSSAMPHKVNPINFENAEGNLGLANGLFEFFARKLPISRLQRDLSDSTVERNFGSAFGYCLIAYTNIVSGMGKIHPNESVIRQALADHPEVLAEAYQTKLRAIGYPEGYKALMELTRGRKVTLEDMHAFVRELDEARVPAEAKAEMLALRPDTYIGLASKLARRNF